MRHGAAKLGHPDALVNSTAAASTVLSACVYIRNTIEHELAVAGERLYARCAWA
jgi:hypothetical protein